MKKIIQIILIGLILGLIIGFPIITLWADSGATVYVIPIDGEITPAMAAFFSKVVKEAQNNDIDTLLVEVSTLGGRVDSALSIKRSIEKSKIPVVVYIKDRALSAGALISISAPRIFMAPGSHMGAAEPIPYSAKSVAAIRGEFEAIAERNGRDKTIAAAMVDKDIDIPGLSPPGSLLDITAETAKEYGYAEEVLESRHEVLGYVGLRDATVVERPPDILVRLAQFLTQNRVSTIVLPIGIISIIIEIFTKGFGIFGIVGISALTLYFGANLMAGYSQWWPIFLFIIGIALLVIEAFIPGFGVVGIGGISAMLIGIIFAAPDPTRGAKNLGIALIAVIIITPISMYLALRFGAFRRFILWDSPIDKPDDQGENKDIDLLGRVGIALSALRPSGIVDIGGVRVDAISRGEFISPGTRIKVIESTGLSLVVAQDGNTEK